MSLQEHTFYYDYTAYFLIFVPVIRPTCKNLIETKKNESIIVN